MTEFLDWHPSSYNAQKLYEQRNILVKQIYLNPVQAFKHLESFWNFGRISEIWDDYIFDNIVRPVLDQNLNSKLVDSINRYSAINHLLFKPYIRREENPTRFRRAFWNVHSYGLRISRNVQLTFPENQSSSNNPLNLNSDIKKIAFIFKGPYKLAHSEFLRSFLVGCKFFLSKVQVHLILIDESSIDSTDLSHIVIHSLAYNKSASNKIAEYIKLCRNEQFDHICWVACVQDLTLYMGLQLASSQSYWSMKYHSIIMPTIQKYAGLGFGGNSFEFDDVKWFRGRAFPDLLMPKISKDSIEKLRDQHNIPRDSCLIGCFVRAEKLYDTNFQESVIKILRHDHNVHFAIASQFLPENFKKVLESYGIDCINRFHYLGWINTKNWVANLDIYYDSSPRGSCNTIFEAIEMGVPILMSDSTHNRESSALPYILSAAKNLNIDEERVPGVFKDESKRLERCKDLIESNDSRMNLASQQMKMLVSLKGQSHLFAKDYLNFFLDTNIKLRELNP